MQVGRSVPELIKVSILWSCVMFRNYLKTAFRNLKKYKGYSFINIAGLAIGMACCILILLWVQDEVSYDRFHVNGERICRVIQREHTQKKKAITPAPYGPALKTDFAEIVEYARLGQTSRRLFQAGEKTFYESDLYFVDPSFLTMFSFPLLKGDPETALSDPYSAVISERMAEKYFGEDDPIGKSLTIQQSFEVIITGIMRPFPTNSHLNTDFLGHFEILEKEFGRGVGWSNNSYTTYLQLAERVSIDELGRKIEDMVLKYRPQSNSRVYLQPLDAIYLRSDFDYDFTGSGGIRATYVTIFSIIAFFVMAIACMNFINLSTAQSAKRAKEVGIRKVSGANRVQLIRQFLSESAVTSFFALIVAIKP